MNMRALFGTCLLACGVTACGGGGGSNMPAPSPGPGTPTPPQNPCATSTVEEGDLVQPVTGPASDDKKLAIDGSPRGRVLDALWTHRQGALRRDATARLAAPSASAPAPDAADVGEIAVIQDEGDLVLPPNAYDLRNLGLRFTRNGSSGYDVRRIDAAFRTTLGNRLTLQDDDTVAANVPFNFPFYGGVRTAAFVNSDGNITFDEGDKASTERNVARLLTGPPRVSPFLADLDPSVAGRIFVHAAADQYTVTWCSVRGFESTRTATVQATLLPDGTIEMKFGDTLTLPDMVVGLSPGRTGTFTPVNLSDAGPTAGGAGAVGERFAERGQLDTVELTRKFYRTHPDNYDQLVIWSDAALIRDAFAYETTIANEILGIGQDIYDLSRDFGSGGRLRSLAVMDFIGKYPDDPTRRFLGENNTLSVLGQEVGHRWLAFLEFRDHNGARSDVLLGRGLSHWSFFFDSDASVMEGNDVEDLGGGSFRTVATVQRYSRLDQYAMGLIPDTAVPSFFYVESPINIIPARERESGPQTGVTFNGTRRDVLIRDVIAIHGPRVPSASDSTKTHRQAFVFMVSAGQSVNGDHVAKLDNIRRQWEGFFLNATDGRMRVDTRLR